MFGCNQVEASPLDRFGRGGLMDFETVPDELSERLRSGDDRAAEAVFRRYAERLAGLARLRLTDRLRRKVDAEDVVQSVFRSFFTRSAKGEFDFADWDGVWGLLVLMTVRKCVRRARHFEADRRDARREVADTVNGAIDPSILEAIAEGPTAEDAAILTETTEEIMRALRSDKERRVFELSLQGFSVAEISDMVGHYERGVERIRAKVKRMLEAKLNGEAS